jgi:hypothetical protein
MEILLAKKRTNPSPNIEWMDSANKWDFHPNGEPRTGF